MATKTYKPCKGVAKRFKVTGTGKVKRMSGFNSHRRSVRSAAMKRRIRRPQIMFEGHAENLREYMGLTGLRPRKVAHERALAAKIKAMSETSAA